MILIVQQEASVTRSVLNAGSVHPNAPVVLVLMYVQNAWTDTSYGMKNA